MSQDISIIVPVHDPDDSLARCLRMLDAQLLRAREIVLVDDGSIPPLPDSVGDGLKTPLRLLRLPRNIGRAGARNAGARAAHGTMLVFVDSDCVVESPEWLQAHLAAISAGAFAATGPLRGDGDGFWDRYQQGVSARRRAQHAAGDHYAGTTANLSMRASAFVLAGCFDEEYDGYGFEDRDLLLRVAQHGPIAWIDASVRHVDELRLSTIRLKLIEAGGKPANRFAARHPAAYARLGYARVDVRLHPVLRPLAPLANALSRGSAWLGDLVIARGWMPYAIGRHWVKATTALAFLVGTARR